MSESALTDKREESTPTHQDHEIQRVDSANANEEDTAPPQKDHEIQRFASANENGAQANSAGDTTDVSDIITPAHVPNASEISAIGSELADVHRDLAQFHPKETPPLKLEKSAKPSARDLLIQADELLQARATGDSAAHNNQIQEGGVKCSNGTEIGEVTKLGKSEREKIVGFAKGHNLAVHHDLTNHLHPDIPGIGFQSPSAATSGKDSVENTPRPYRGTCSGNTAQPDISPRKESVSGAKMQSTKCAVLSGAPSASTSIHAAARWGDVDWLQTHLDANPDSINSRDSMNFTPAHFASCYGENAALSVLITAGASVELSSAHGWTPLHLACRNGHTDCVSTLLAHRATPDTTDHQKANAVHNACCSGNTDVLELLLKAELSEEAAQAAAAEGYKLCNAKDSDGWGPLHFAARFNHSDALERLLVEGADPDLQDVDGWTACHNSTRNGRNRCVQLLLEYKGDVCCVTRYGETALHIACRKGKAKVAAMIVDLAEKQNKLAPLLELKDSEGHSPNEFSLVQSILRREPKDGSSYNMSQFDNRNDGMPSARPHNLKSRVSKFCCVM